MEFLDRDLFPKAFLIFDLNVLKFFFSCDQTQSLLFLFPRPLMGYNLQHLLLFQIFPFYDEAVLDVMNRFEKVLYGEIIN